MERKRLFDRTPIIVAIIAAAPILVVGYWQFVWKPSPSTQQIEYFGRVIDNKTGATLSGVKVSLEFSGAPPIRYTDSEGVYRFTVSSTGKELSGRIRVEFPGYQPYDRHIRKPHGETSLEDIRLTPVSPTPSDPKSISSKQSSQGRTSGNAQITQCDSIPFELTAGKQVRITLINGRKFVGDIQLHEPFNQYLSKNLIPLLTYTNMQKLKRRFGEQNCSENAPEFGCYGLPPHEANAHIDWINIDHIHTCEIVERTLNNFLLVTRSGKRIDMSNTDRFGLEVGIGNVPGSVKIKYKLPDLEKSFELGEFDIKNSIVSLPVTTVFISYAPENRKEAISLASSLQNHGILTWFHEDVTLPGDNPETRMAQIIEQVDYFLPMLSCQYNKKELDRAMHHQSSFPENKRFIIPIQLDDCDIPLNLRKLTPLKLTDKDWLNKLTRSMAPLPPTGS